LIRTTKCGACPVHVLSGLHSGVLSFLVLLCWLCEVLRYQCRFFTPTILFLKSRGHNVHILCVSLGKVASLFSCMSLFSLHLSIRPGAAMSPSIHLIPKYSLCAHRDYFHENILRALLALLLAVWTHHPLIHSRTFWKP
jgi:hypothetical protein